MKDAILQIIPKLDTGGAERTTIDMAAAIADAGYAALVVSEGGRLECELGEAGGELIRLPAASKSPYTIWRNAQRLVTLIRTRNVRLVHARSRAPAWSALLAARRARVPFVTTYHGHYSSGNPLKHWYNGVMVRGDIVIANSQFTAEHIAREYRRHAPIVTIPRGLDEVAFDPEGIADARREALRGQFGIGPGETIILLPGRMTRWKGQLVLIEAVAALPATQRAGLRVVLAGDAQGRDAYAGEVKAAIAAKGLTKIIHIAGHVQDMPAAYDLADIVVSASSDAEAFGRVAAEAAAMGRAVIATAHGGARETVADGQSGLLIEPGNAQALAAALGRLLAAGPQSRADMGAAGRAHVLSRFTRTAMCRATMAVYHKLLHGNS